jgi:hypothetical protein
LSRSLFSWHYKVQSLPHVRQVRLVSLVKDQVRKIGGVDATLGAIADRLRIGEPRRWNREQDNRILTEYGLKPGSHPDYEIQFRSESAA